MDKEELLARLRQEWEATIEDKGGYCTCCRRWGKINSYKITKSMVKSLLWLSQFRDWVNLPVEAPRWILRTYSISTLARWGLIEQMAKEIPDDPEEQQTTKHSGMWRITPLGREFLHGRTSVPERVYIYDKEVIKVSDAKVYVYDCYEDFNYGQMMNERAIDAQALNKEMEEAL